MIFEVCVIVVSESERGNSCLGSFLLLYCNIKRFVYRLNLIKDVSSLLKSRFKTPFPVLRLVNSFTHQKEHYLRSSINNKSKNILPTTIVFASSH